MSTGTPDPNPLFITSWRLIFFIETTPALELPQEPPLDHTCPETVLKLQALDDLFPTSWKQVFGGRGLSFNYYTMNDMFTNFIR